MKELLVFLVLAATLQYVGALSCYKTYTDIWGITRGTYIYCGSSYSCCGTYSTRYCCYDTVYYGVGSLVGGIIGGIIFLIVVIVIIVCICKHNNRSRGTVIHHAPANNPNVTVVSATQQSQQMHPTPAYPPAYPPPYPPPPAPGQPF